MLWISKPANLDFAPGARLSGRFNRGDDGLAERFTRPGLALLKRRERRAPIPGQFGAGTAQTVILINTPAAPGLPCGCRLSSFHWLMISMPIKPCGQSIFSIKWTLSKPDFQAKTVFCRLDFDG